MFVWNVVELLLNKTQQRKFTKQCFNYILLNKPELRVLGENEILKT